MIGRSTLCSPPLFFIDSRYQNSLEWSKTREAREKPIIEFTTHSNSAYTDPVGLLWQ